MYDHRNPRRAPLIAFKYLCFQQLYRCEGTAPRIRSDQELLPWNLQIFVKMLQFIRFRLFIGIKQNVGKHRTLSYYFFFPVGNMHPFESIIYIII